MVDPSDYAREIERYLCQKNDGHLIRIVGPAFEQVCGWAQQGVPLKLAFRGIDRCCERYYAKGPRRRPVRIEFCEADILELFDGWRRAVGVRGADAVAGAVPEEPKSRKPALAAHVERALARLVHARARVAPGSKFVDALDGVVRELEALLDDARGARGERRAGIIDVLARLDDRMMEAARAEITAADAERLRRDAEEELAPFASRMAPAARHASLDAVFGRLVREAFGLPLLRYE